MKKFILLLIIPLLFSCKQVIKKGVKNIKHGDEIIKKSSEDISPAYVLPARRVLKKDEKSDSVIDKRVKHDVQRRLVKRPPSRHLRISPDSLTITRPGLWKKQKREKRYVIE